MLYIDPIEFARFYHSAYEGLVHGESATPWEQAPAPNRRLMIATARRVITEFLGGQCMGEIVSAERNEKDL